MHHRRCGHPKIADLLALPEARPLRDELKLARSLGVPPTRLRGRLRSTTYLYEDLEYPDRVTGTVESPEWTEDDRGLLLGLELWESQICPGNCGHPIGEAWHTDNDGWYETQGFKCYACTELAGGQDVVFHQVDSTRGPDAPPLTPFEMGVTTFAPDPPATD